MIQVHVNHIVICHAHRDILSELSSRDIAKEFVRSTDARCRVFCKIHLLSRSTNKIWAYFLFIVGRSHAKNGISDMHFLLIGIALCNDQFFEP